LTSATSALGAAPSDAVRAPPGALGIVLAYQLVGVGLALSECVQRAFTQPEVLRATYKQSLSVLLATGTALGLAVALLAFVRRRLRTPPQLFYGALLAIGAYALGINLIGGAWIARQWFAPFGPAVLALIALSAGWRGSRIARDSRMAPTWVWTAGLGTAGVVLAAVDAVVLPGLYPVLHVALLTCAWVALAHALIGSPWRPRFWIGSGRLRLVAIVLLAASLPSAWWKSPALSHRLQWDRSPGYASRVYEQARLTIWRLESGSLVTRYAPAIKRWLLDDPRMAPIRFPEANAAWRAVTAPRAQSRSSLDARRRPHIVLITVDALRADVAALGPQWSELAARGSSFSRAYSPASATDRSLPALVTGHYDWHRQEGSLVEALSAVGYHTAFVSHRFAVDYLRYHEQIWLSRVRTVVGVDEPRGKRTSAQVIELATKLMRARPATGPLFAWVHFFDLHEWARDRAVTGTPRQRYEQVWKAQDEAVGALVRAAASELSDRPTVFILTSDHGEYLGEDGRVAHTRWVGLEATHVPLVLIAPGRLPEIVSRPVGLLDVAATIAELAGLPGFESDGISLSKRAVDPRRPLVMGDTLEIGIVRGPHRLLLAPLLGGVTIFDDTDITAPKRLDPADLPDAEQQLLLPLLGSPMASAQASPLNDP
jgi:hypothetical protein